MHAFARDSPQLPSFAVAGPRPDSVAFTSHESRRRQMGHRINGRAIAIALRVRAALGDRAIAIALRVRAALGDRAYGIALRARAALGERTGQGTVEYVALILLVAGLFATVVVAAGGVKGDGIAHAITDKIKSTID